MKRTHRYSIVITTFVLTLTGCLSIGVVDSGGGNGDPVSVTYASNGADDGAVPSRPVFYDVGDTVEVLDNRGNLRKEGHPFFFGWNTRADGRGDEYTPGETFTMPNENLTLYALWLEPQKIVTDNGFGRHFRRLRRRRRIG